MIIFLIKKQIKNHKNKQAEVFQNKNMKKNCIKYILLAAIALFGLLPSFADVYNHPANLKTLSEQVPVMGDIKCKFKQKKYIKNISKPLVSEGDFEFIKNRGVYFHTTYPVVSDNNFTNKNYKQINEIIRAISTKKYDKPSQEFDFYFEKTADSWTIGLCPKKSSNIKDYISNITIYGSSYIKQIVINQKGGNKTVIWFIK